jgi:hypothetical protein
MNSVGEETTSYLEIIWREREEGECKLEQVALVLKASGKVLFSLAEMMRDNT